MARSVRLWLEPVLTGSRLRRRRGFGSRSRRHRARWPGVLLGAVGVLAGVGLLVAVAHVHGDSPEGDSSFPDAELATLSEPAVAAAASLLALVLIAWSVRRLLLEYFGWRPGPIVVKPFVAPEEELSAADAERLTTGFRDRLSMSHLQSAAAVPAGAEQGDFLDVLARGAADGGGMLGMITTFLRAGLPDHAYEVNGALVKRDGPLPYGVTVQVTRLPGKGAGGHTVWDRSWEGAVRKASDHATAAILPQTRACRSPWAGWRRYYMPPELLRAYEDAADCEEARRYDEALGYYYEALDQDPMNLGLRLQIGYLQEKLRLYLDALDTYEGILTIADSPERRRFWPPRRVREIRKAYCWRARWDRDRRILVTRYRRAVLLGGGEVARHWVKPHKGRKRDDERADLRERLAACLTKLFQPALDEKHKTKLKKLDAGMVQVWPEIGPWNEALRKSPIDPGAVPEPELKHMLLVASMYAFGDVIHRIPLIRAPWKRRTLSRQAVRVSRLIVKQRLRELLAPAATPAAGNYVKEIKRELARIESGRFHRWQEHYNAACVFALPLKDNDHPQPEPAVAKELAEEAILRLEQASARADSAFLASRRDWVLTEDPDLNGLRQRREFKAFEAAYFPSASRPPQRPPEAHRWEASRYTIDLLQAATRRWEEVWRRRASNAPAAELDVVARWCADDLAACELVRDVAVDYRDWHTRNALLTRMREWSTANGFEPLSVPFPRFSADGEWNGDADTIEEKTEAYIEENMSRLEDLDHELEIPPEPPLAYRKAGLPVLTRVDVARLCTLRADRWGKARETITLDNGSAPTSPVALGDRTPPA
jgi:hypothetical protein